MSSRERVYEAITAYTSQNGHPPTVREICKLVDLRSTATVHSHIKALVKEGRIENKDFKSRTIKLNSNIKQLAVVSSLVDFTDNYIHHSIKDSDKIVILEKEDGVPTKFEWGGHMYTLQKEPSY